MENSRPPNLVSVFGVARPDQDTRRARGGAAQRSDRPGFVRAAVPREPRPARALRRAELLERARPEHVLWWGRAGLYRLPDAGGVHGELEQAPHHEPHVRRPLG